MDNSIHMNVSPQVMADFRRAAEKKGQTADELLAAFVTQVAETQETAFEIKPVPNRASGRPKPVCMRELTDEELEAELQKGLDDIAAGRMISLEELKAEMHREFGI
ncbi:MAG: hypothetical protein IJ493_00990 [Clostridia bacterium]|nr:hypothetical protein [Clostridia bacterium]